MSSRRCAIYLSGQRGRKNLRISRTMAGAVVAVVVDEKLEVLHVAKKTWGLDHLQTLLQGGLFYHLLHKPHGPFFRIFSFIAGFPSFLFSLTPRSSHQQSFSLLQQWFPAGHIRSCPVSPGNSPGCSSEETPRISLDLPLLSTPT